MMEKRKGERRHLELVVERLTGGAALDAETGVTIPSGLLVIAN